jgi:FAD-dependent oxidoreductase domain-containing protein 1
MKFDIAIIGGGIIGSAAAHFLAKSGNAGNIAVIEPDSTYARASTPQGAGGVRRLFSRPENIQMSQMSLDFYSNFAAETGLSEGADISFRRQGYLFVVGPDGVQDLDKNYNQQISMGVPAELLDPQALRDRFPSLGVDDIAMGCSSPEDAWIDPNSAMRGLRKSAIQMGVTYIQDKVVGIQTRDQQVVGVILQEGQMLEADYFLNTAGPWCSDIAAMIDARLPVRPMCRVQHYWKCATQLEPMPLVKDESGMFFRPEGEGFAGGCPSFDIEPGFNFDIDRGFFANYFENTVWPLIARRVPAFEQIRLQRTWGGHYAQNTFDGNMIIGRFSKRFANIITACGFSGHGLMHAPAVGRALAELVINGDYQSIDLSRLEFTRVENDKPYAEEGIK